jgi:hypothetical protein
MATKTDLSGEAAVVDASCRARPNPNPDRHGDTAPIVIFILLKTSASWVEPLLFLGLGVSVVINMGGNKPIFGPHLLMTNFRKPHLQLWSRCIRQFFCCTFRRSPQNLTGRGGKACGRHQAILFGGIRPARLLPYSLYRAEYSCSSRPRRWSRLILAKGIILSFICVIVSCPRYAVPLQVIDRTRHREWTPSFKKYMKLSKVAIRKKTGVRRGCPDYRTLPALARRHTGFCYGSTDFNQNSRLQP